MGKSPNVYNKSKKPGLKLDDHGEAAVTDSMTQLVAVQFGECLANCQDQAAQIHLKV